MEVRRHLIIAGTGRAGTSFLVRYLTALGLDTGLGRYDEDYNWDEAANAGLEHLPLVEDDGNTPYVMKSPWVGEYIEEIIKSKSISIDAIVVPVRDLVEAASSRSILEHRALHQRYPWMADRLERTWDVFGWTPGGTIFSLDPNDQARLLAVGFHRLLHKAVEGEIRTIMMAFPRFINDWDYLYRSLRPVLPAGVTADQARKAHEQVASRELVRVEDELSGLRPSGGREGDAVLARTRHPTMSDIDSAALRRELRRVRAEADRSRSEGSQFRAEGVRLREEADHLRGEVERLRAETLTKKLQRSFGQLFRYSSRLVQSSQK